MFCPNCGKEVREGTAFCSECGTKMQAAPQQQAPAPSAFASPPPVPAYMPPPQPPAVSGGQFGPTATYVATPTGEFSSGDCIREGWAVVSSNLGLFVVSTLLYFGILIVAGIIPGVNVLSNLVLTMPLTAGLYIIAFKSMDNQGPAIGDLFGGFQNFIQLVLLNLVMGILIALGFILLIIPGIYLAVSYTFALPLILERNMDFWTAMETSRKEIGQRWFQIFGFGILLFLLNLLGAIALGIGLFVTLPITFCAIAIAYRKIFGR